MLHLYAVLAGMVVIGACHEVPAARGPAAPGHHDVSFQHERYVLVSASTEADPVRGESLDRWVLELDRSRSVLRLSGPTGTEERRIARVPADQRPLDCATGGMPGPDGSVPRTVMARLETYRVEGAISIHGHAVRAPLLVAQCTDGALLIEQWEGTQQAGWRDHALYFDPA